MMTRNIRKVISIICAVALVLSLGVVAFTGTTSAFKLGDTPTGSALYLDFENGKGVADYNGAETGFAADPENPENGVFKVVTGIGGGSYNFMPGNSADAEADTTSASTAFKLETNTTYIITFKLKLGKNSSGGMTVSKYLCQNSDKFGKTDLQQFFEYTVDATNGVLYDDSAVYHLAEDSEWMPIEFTFTTPASWSTATTGGLNDRLVFVCNSAMAGADFSNVYYFDDFTIDAVTEAVYEFDGEKGTTGEYWNPGVTSGADANNLFANSGDVGGSYVDAAGYHLRPTSSTSAGYGVLGSVNGTGWTKVLKLRDPDIGDGKGDVNMKAGYKYLLSMKFKIANIDEANRIRLAVGYLGSSGSGYTVIAPIGEYDAKTGWLTFETIIDGSTAPSGLNTYAGNQLFILMANQKGTSGVCETLIESIKLHEFKDDGSLSIVKYNANGGNSVATEVVANGTVINPPIPTHSDSNKAFAGWYFDVEFKNAVPANYAPDADVTLYAKWSSEFVNITFVCDGKVTTSRIANGTTLPRPERPNAKLFFLGWCTDKALTDVVTKAPGQDCTLYAKFDYAYSGFNQGGYSDKTSTVSGFTIVPEPGNAKNNVLQLKQDANMGSGNVEFSVGDIAGAPAYELELNTKYLISFRYKIAPTEFGGDLTLYTGAQSEYSVNAPKMSTGNVIKWEEGFTEKGTDWVTVTYYYQTGDSFYNERVYWTEQNRFYLVLSGIKDGVRNTAPATIYIDDLIIGPVTDKAPEGAITIKFNTNSTEMSPIYGYPGEKIIMPENPTLSSHKFLGWYTDKNFQNKFTATAYGDKDVDLYAKWELTDWTMNFDDHEYNAAAMSGRYTFKTEANGNKYLHYRYEDAATSTVAPSTAGPEAFGRITFNRGNDSPYLSNDAVTYVITFKYKVVESTGANPRFRGMTANKFTTWDNGVEHGSPIDLGAPSEEWKTGQFIVKPNADPDTANHLGFAVSGDATILFDDFVVEPDIDLANIYGTTIISFDSNGGSEIDAIGGNPGDKIVLPSTKPTRPGFIFKGWYTDATGTTKFADTEYGEDSIMLVAGWALAKLSENFEGLPASVQTQGISGGYTYYNNSVAGFDSANVKDGTSSILRKADVTGVKGFTLCREATMTLDVGSQYTLTMYVKPTNVGDAAGTINLISMSTYTSVSVPDATDVITTVGELKAGEWQQINYTFTAKEQFVGISTSEGNEIYFDAANINIVGYVGSDTGDTSVSPVIIAMMVLLAAGALLVTGKKVFSK